MTAGVKLVRIVDPLKYRINGAGTLQEAVEREIRCRYGPGVAIEFYFGLRGDGRPVSELAGKLVMGEPEVSLIARVTLPDSEQP